MGQASFSEDFIFRARKSNNDIQFDEHILNSTLLDIENRLLKLGNSLSQFPGMPLHKSTRSPYQEALIIQKELDYDINEQLKIIDCKISSHNYDQQTVFDAVMTAVNSTDQS